MKKGIITLFLLLVLCLFITNAYSQEVSEKKDVSVFNLSYYGWKLPESVVGNIDSTIRSVVVNMGRFKVIEVRKRFESTDDLFAFMDSIKKIKEKEIEIPDEVTYGHVVFTEADYESLVSSFIVFIPEVTFYEIKTLEDDDGEFAGYEAKLRTSYSVLDASTMEVVAKPDIETTGTADTKDSAWDAAVQDIKMQLEFELKKIPIFTIKTGVLDVSNGVVTLQLGKDMGIKTGYEFELIKTNVLASGFKKETSAGLVLVKSVYEEISEGIILYGNPEEGDQLKEVPRMGLEGSLYIHVMMDILGGGSLPGEFAVAAGIKSVYSMGFFFFKWVACIEIPFADFLVNDYLYAQVLDFGFPANILIGFELNFYFGRIQISPTLLGGVGGIFPFDEGDDPAFSHLGVKAFLSNSYLLTRDIKVALDLGYAQWFSVNSALFEDYGGVLAGISVIFKI